MNGIPSVRLGSSGIRVSRLIGGGNPLCGNSHRSKELSEEMRRYFTDETAVDYLKSLESNGVNTIQARADYQVLHWLELFKRSGGSLNWIAQTASEMSDVLKNIRMTAAAGAVAIYHHGTQTDAWWGAGEIDRVGDYIKCMRDCAVQVGLGTHIPEVIEYAEERGWDLDFYMACFYNLSRDPRDSAIVSGGFAPATEAFLEQDPPRMCKTIRATERMCLAFKILAAGRKCETPGATAEAFRYAFANIKDRDAVVVGMFPKYEDQVAHNIEHVIKACRCG